MIPRGLLCAVVLATTAAPGAAWSAPFQSIHQQALQEHAGSPTFSVDELRPPSPELLASSTGRDEDGVTVMGYLPYWVSPDNIPWEVIDILAWFTVGVEADGSLGNDHGWGDAEADAVIEAAHQVGARVVLSATRFGGSDLHDLLSNPNARSHAIDNLVQAMLSGGGDGLDIDFEGLWVEDRDAMVAFIQELRTEMDAALPGSLLTMATPAIDWSGAWDYDVLAASADVLFIMGYSFHGSFSGPGPVAPLDGGDVWSSRGLRWSVQDYVEWTGEENLHKVVLGLPLYGYAWETSDGEVPPESSGDSWPVFWAPARELADEHGSSWDEESSTPFSSWEVGQDDWRQLWFDDPDSIGLKIAMAREEGIGGFGFWALNYDEGDVALWDVVSDEVDAWRELLGDDDDDSAGDDDDSGPDSSQPSAVVTATSPIFVGELAVLDASASSDPQGDLLSFSWSQEAGEPVELVGVDQAVATFLGEELGLLTFSVEISDGSSPLVSASVEVRVLPDPQEGSGGQACACSQPGDARAPGAALLALGLLLGMRRRRC